MSAIQKFQPGGEISPRELAAIEHMAKRMAVSKLCPKQFRNKPDDLILVGFTCADLGVPFNLPTVDEFYVIDGSVEMMAQLQIGVAAGHGIDLWLDEAPGACTNKAASVFVQKPGKPARRVTYTIEIARDYGLLDDWVERRVKDGTWPDGNTKYKTERFTVAVDGVPIEGEFPEWVQAKVKAGEVQRNDRWFRARTQMLMNRATTMALKFNASNALLGIRHLDLGDIPEPPPGVDGETGEIHPDPTAKDDEPAEPDEIDGKPHTPTHGADDWDRAALQTELAELDTEHRLIASKAWKEAGLPKIDSDALTKDHEVDAHRILSTVGLQQKEAHKTRQKRANALLGEIGIKGDDRHAAVREATGDETESTVERYKAEHAEPGDDDDPFDEPPVQDELSPDEF